MKIIVNGQPLDLADADTVDHLLELLNLKGKLVAVERNREIVSFRDYEKTTLNDGDSLEIVSLVGGG